MSASLVGSEMCIRDRRHFPAKAVRQGCDATVFAPTSEKPWAPPTSNKACLLYTSDAADDM
eukprot:3959453-Alexandrium_andersonii.AAC.1